VSADGNSFAWFNALGSDWCRRTIRADTCRKKQVPKQKGQKSLLEMYGMGIAKTSNKQTCSRIFQQHKETVAQLLEQERLPRLGSGALLALTCSWTQFLLRSEVCDILQKTITTTGKNMNQHA